MGWRAEVWNLPESTPHEVVIKSLPAVDVTWSNGVGIVGTGTVTLPKSYARLDEVVDGSENVQSLIRVYWDGAFAFAFFPEFTTKPYKEAAAAVVDVSGDGVKSLLRSAIAYPYDYPAFPTKTADHMYGNEDPVSGFSNGSMDDFVLNGDAETGETAPWKSTSASADFKAPDTDVIVQNTDVRNGTYAFECDPSGYHSGMVRPLPVLPGQTYVFRMYIKEPTAVGDRYTMGIKMGEESTLDVGAKIYNDIGLCELDGAAYRAGVSDGTWQVIDGTVTFGPEVESTQIYAQYDDHTGGSSKLFRMDDFTVSGPGIGLDPWIPRGEWDIFELDTARKKDGVNSCKFRTTSASVLGGTGIAQEISDLVIGKTYTWSGFFSHDGAGNEPLRMVVWRQNGPFIASVLKQIPAGTDFTYVAATFVAESTTVTVDFRYDAAGASPNIWFDKAIVSEGLPRATWGAILLDMMDDIMVDHVAEVAPGAPRSVLPYVKYDSITAILDSGGLTWDAELSVTVPLGQNYDQMTAQGRKLGYEMDIVWDGSEWELVAFNKDGMGTDYSAAKAPAVVQGSAIASGQFQQAVAQATRGLGVGAEGIWTEVFDVAAETALGRREAFVPDIHVLNLATLAARTDETVTAFQRTTTGIKLTFTEYAAALPIRDFTYGDVVNVKLPNHGVDDAFRVEKISCRWGKTGESTFTVDFASEVITAGAATSVAVAKILDQFKPLSEGADVFGGVGDYEPFTGPIEATYLVAAANARAAIRALADFKCGISDGQEEYAAAATALYDDGSAVGGILQLTAGTFKCSDYLPTDSSQKNFWIRGAGLKSTHLITDAATPASDRWGFVSVSGDHCKVTDLSLVIDDDQFLSAISIGGNYFSLVARVHVQIIPDATEANLRGGIWVGDDVIVEDCWVDSFSEGTGIIVQGDRVLVTGCMVENATTQGLLDGDGIVVLNGSDDVKVIGNTMETSGFGTIAGAAIRIAGDRAIVIGNVCPDGIIIESTADGTIVGGNTGTITDNGTNTIFLDLQSPLTTKGDLWTFDTDDARLAIGTDEYALFADSGETPGLKWAAIEQVATLRIPGTLVTGLDGFRWYAPFALTLLAVEISVGTAPTDADVILDVNKATTSIYPTATKPTIAASGFVSGDHVPDTTAVADGDYLQLEVDQIGSTVAGADLTCTIRYRRTP